MVSVSSNVRGVPFLFIAQELLFIAQELLLSLILYSGEIKRLVYGFFLLMSPVTVDICKPKGRGYF